MTMGRGRSRNLSGAEAAAGNFKNGRFDRIRIIFRIRPSIKKERMKKLKYTARWHEGEAKKLARAQHCYTHSLTSKLWMGLEAYGTRKGGWDNSTRKAPDTDFVGYGYGIYIKGQISG